MKDILGEKVEKVVVSDRLVDSPCILVTGEWLLLFAMGRRASHLECMQGSGRTLPGGGRAGLDITALLNHEGQRS